MKRVETPSYTDAVRASRKIINNDHLIANARQTREIWGIYDSPIKSYQDYFGVLIGGKPLASIVSERSAPVVVDLMSSSEALAGLLRQLPQKNKRGIALTLTDNRSLYKKGRDRYLGIEQLSGDLTHARTWHILEERVGEGQADLIMERAAWGVKYAPHHKDYYAYAMNKLWTMLSPDNGHLLMEVPSEYYMKKAEFNMTKWIDSLFGSLSVTYLENMGTNNNGLLKLIKTPHSPKVLPRP